MILKVIVLDLKNSLLFITFINPPLMIKVCEILLGKFFSLAKLIQQLSNWKQKIMILNSKVIETSIIYIKLQTII